MADARDANRNPLVIPTEVPAAKTRGCRYCGSSDYVGHNSGGVVTMTCNACGGKWYGGIGQVPQDPTVPAPPLDPRSAPNLEFIRNHKTGETEEIFRRPDPTPPFRKGAPIPAPGEEDDAW